MKHFDVIVVGGGHAGCEAALASSRMGRTTALLSLDPSKIAEMSCNPSVGGVGKGQLVKEIDALGGEMGINADYTAIQFKRLNTRKGSAVQSTRCQSDKIEYAKRMRSVLAKQPNLTVIGGEAKDLLIEGERVLGVSISVAGEPIELSCGALVITSGTFMKAVMHCGDEVSEGGRHGEAASNFLSDKLRSAGFSLLRLKTGTPPRLLRDSIDFSQMERQVGDVPPRKFSFWSSEIPLRQVECYLTRTSPAVHAEIRKGLHRSPLYSGKIQGIGPRYCPSIEDKVVKFPEKTAHQLFFEPESLSSDWIYPNGISSSLPSDIQEKFVREIPGCRDVVFARYAYAVEYDCIDPTQLTKNLESKRVSGLFFAGQVNGTSGYEEAAAQGLVAGINAALFAGKSDPLILPRSESYIGVMIDDLTSVGVSEPYRMFTSRAEYRLSLREDNADLRLSKYGYDVGLLSKENYEAFLNRKSRIETGKKILSSTWVRPSEETNRLLAHVGLEPMENNSSLASLIKRPELGLDEVSKISGNPELCSFGIEDGETLEIEVKYEGYIALQREEIDRLHKLRALPFPKDFSFDAVHGLSSEVRQKLNRSKPETIADAAGISGVTPAALTNLIASIKRANKKGAAPASV